jgi:hypothetical protein
MRGKMESLHWLLNSFDSRWSRAQSINSIGSCLCTFKHYNLQNQFPVSLLQPFRSPEKCDQDSKLKLCMLQFSLPGHELAIENLIAVQFVSHRASFSWDTELQLQQTRNFTYMWTITKGKLLKKNASLQLCMKKFSQYCNKMWDWQMRFLHSNACLPFLFFDFV